jgi:hypothetical protein
VGPDQPSSIVDEGRKSPDESVLAPDISLLLPAEHGDISMIGGTEPEPEPVPAEDMGPPAPKPSRKRKSERIDSQTELSSAKITEGLNDTSDITAERQSTPLTKRQMLRAQLEDKDWMDEILGEPASIGSSNKLIALFRRTATLEVPEPAVVPPPPEPHKEEKEEEKEGKDEDMPPAEIPGTEDTGLGDITMLPDAERTIDDEEARRQAEEDAQAREKEREERERAEMSEKPPSAKELIARTQKMYALLKKKFGETDSLSFSELLGDSPNRATAAGSFYQLLVLKTEDYIQVKQPKPYGDIAITTTKRFGEPLRMAVAR